MDLRFFALVHKYSLVLDPIRIEKVIFFRFLGGGPPLNFFTPTHCCRVFSKPFCLLPTALESSLDLSLR